MMRTVIVGAAFLLLALGLNLPTSLADLGRLGTWAIPLELLLAATLVAWTRGRWRGAALVAACALLAWFIVFRIVDWAVWQAMGRPVTLALDLPLLPSLVEVARESLGPLAVAALVLGSFTSLLVVGAVAFNALSAVARLPHARAWTSLALLAAGAGVAAGANTPRHPRAELPLVSHHGLHQARAQIARAAAAADAERRWTQTRQRDADRGLAGADLLGRLRDVDVWLVFVESYGRTVLEAADLAPVVGPALARLERAVGDAGLLAASGWMDSPAVGGQSWLAHATLVSGFRTEDETGHAVYRRHAEADLAHLFARAGHRPVLVVPGMTRPYPEALHRFGFAQVLTALDLGYAGPRFDWVTMPDQFVLDAVWRRLTADQGPPAYVQVALVGSHAPFTPRPTLVDDWSAIGDGAIYARLPQHGDAAAIVWRSRDAIRAAYGEVMALTLDTLAGFAPRLSDRDALLILVGDHEPAAIVTGDPAARVVPMHVLTSDHALLQPFLDWGFTSGIRPTPTAPVHDMAEFRGFLIEAFAAHATSHSRRHVGGLRVSSARAAAHGAAAPD